MANIQDLISFDGSDGKEPEGSLITDASGNLYGTTYSGSASANADGTVFEITAVTGTGATGYSSTPTVLAEFTGTVPVGNSPAYPQGNLVTDASGNLYATSSRGGSDGEGDVFELAKSGTAYSPTPIELGSFSSSSNSAYFGYPASGSLLGDASGNLYGTTIYGGPSNDGTVFEVAHNGSAPIMVASFNGTDGYYPQGNLIADASGNLYGTTSGGPINGNNYGDGTVFEIAVGDSTPITLATFDSTDGKSPVGLVADAAGNLYGTTFYGGANNAGTVFEIAKTSTGYNPTPITLATFDSTDGGLSSGSLIIDASGNLYGTTAHGGANGDGSVYEIAKTSTGYNSTPITLVSFDGTDGRNPDAGLFADASGNLYGTTQFGGVSNDGTVFEVTDSGYVGGPTVIPETAAVLAGATVSATASKGALAGDSDPNGGTLNISSVSFGGTTDPVTGGSTSTNNPTTIAGAYGTLTIGADGSYSYAATNGLAIVTAADGAPIKDMFTDVVSSSSGTSAPSSLAVTVSLATGGTETVTNPTGSATYTIGATTLTLNETADSTYGGVIQDGSSGNTGGNVVVSGSAPLTLTGVSTYTGKTSVSGTLALAGTASIHSSTKVSLTTSGATLDISGATAGEVINKLGGVAGTVADLGNQNLKIKVQANVIDTFFGMIQDGGISNGTGGSLTLGGPGALILTGANTFTGATTLAAGTLALAGSGSIANSKSLTLQASGATLDISGASSAVAVKNLSGVAGSLIDLGAGTLNDTQTGASTFDGAIQDGGGAGSTGGNLAVAGAAALTLTGVSTYTGKTSVSGTLDLSGTASIHASTKVALTTSGATLDISGATAGEVVNKLGGIAGTVADLGNQNLKIKVQGGTVDTFAGTIQDGGAGGSLTLGGLGELSLTGADSYSGGTTIAAGTLDIAALGAAGNGIIAFANPASNGVATLEIDAAALSGGSGIYSFANSIAGATSSNQVIDLRSLAYVQGSTTATLNGTNLSVNDGSSNVTLHLAATQSKSSFTTASDGNGGTLVYDPPATTHAPATAKIDTSWIEMAMADFGGVTGDMHAHTSTHDTHGMGAAAPFEQHHEHAGKFIRSA